MSQQVWWPERREGVTAFLDDAELRRFHLATEAVDVDAGAVVLHRAAASRSLLIIEDGEVEVVDETLGAPRVLAIMGPGDVAGELGFVDGWPRTQDVRARTPCRLRRLTRENLVDMWATDPALFGKLSIGLAVILAARFREVAAELAPVRAFAASLGEPEVMELPAEPAIPDAEPGSGYDALDEGSGSPDAAIALLRQFADNTRRGVSGL